MTITLMQNNSTNNVVSKSLSTLISNLNGTIKNNTSIVDPVFLVRIPNYSNATNCNYLYCPEFGRYYYVQDVVSVRNDLWELTCHVDVLKTFESEIRAQTAVVARQEEKYNLYLNDSQYKAYQDSEVITKKFPNGFKDYNYILMVAGG